MALAWKSIAVEPAQLSVATVLRCGQSFRWNCIDGTYSIGMKNRVLFLKQDTDNIHYASIGDGLPGLSDKELIADYFQLAVDLKQLYTDWSNDKRFVASLTGIRILRQDPWENLCSFICSSNNNIKRISKMVRSLCQEYGSYIASHDGQDYHDFPPPEALAVDGVEDRLRALGFGYRAKYIAQTAKKLSAMPGSQKYLDTLRELDYSDAHAALLGFSGVGPKVADCVCLMSLDKTDCVPVDTHVWQIARRDYKMNVKSNAVGYKMVQDTFKRLWGPYAGWAHSVLFTSELSDLENGLNIAKSPSPPLPLPLAVKPEPMLGAVKVE